MVLFHAGEIVTKEINAVEQLQKINSYANELLDLLMRWNRGDEEALQILESQVRKVKVRGSEEEVTQSIDSRTRESWPSRPCRRSGNN